MLALSGEIDYETFGRLRLMGSMSQKAGYEVLQPGSISCSLSSKSKEKVAGQLHAPTMENKTVCVLQL